MTPLTDTSESEAEYSNNDHQKGHPFEGMAFLFLEYMESEEYHQAVH